MILEIEELYMGTKIPENCPAWLAQWIGKNDERLCNIEKTLLRLVKRTSSNNSIVKNNPDPKKSDPITFKWLVEKLGVPAMFLLAGYLIKG